MKILQSHTFQKSVKKLHKNQISEVKKAIEDIAQNPLLGDMKKGDLAGIRVYKFRIHHQILFLAYLYEKEKPSLSLIDISSHENFYKSLKKKLS